MLVAGFLAMPVSPLKGLRSLHQRTCMDYLRIRSLISSLANLLMCFHYCAATTRKLVIPLRLIKSNTGLPPAL